MTRMMAIDSYPPAARDLAGLYRDLHAHPELSFQETRTAAIVAGHLRKLGYQTTTGGAGPESSGSCAMGRARPPCSEPTWTACR